MDWRMLAWAMVTDVVGIAIFSVVIQFARSQTSLSGMALIAQVGIVVLAISGGFGLILMVIGMLRKTPVGYRTAGKIGLVSFALGLYSLLLSYRQYLEYNDENMACGGFPPGYWTAGNAMVNRCSIFVTIHSDWAALLYAVVFATSATIFWACIITRLRQSRHALP